MAFSNAERVIISRGKMFFSRRFRMAAPTEVHSWIFSGYSAGNDEEPVRVMPKASAALAIVFAVYICHAYTQLQESWSNITCIYSHRHRRQDPDKHVERCHSVPVLPPPSYHLGGIFHTLEKPKRYLTEVRLRMTPVGWCRHKA